MCNKNTHATTSILCRYQPSFRWAHIFTQTFFGKNWQRIDCTTFVGPLLQKILRKRYFATLGRIWNQKLTEVRRCIQSNQQTTRKGLQPMRSDLWYDILDKVCVFEGGMFQAHRLWAVESWRPDYIPAPTWRVSFCDPTSPIVEHETKYPTVIGRTPWYEVKKEDRLQVSSTYYQAALETPFECSLRQRFDTQHFGGIETLLIERMAI